MDVFRQVHLHTEEIQNLIIITEFAYRHGNSGVSDDDLTTLLSILRGQLI